VNDSHDFSEDTEIEAVLTLGERTVEDEKRIAQLRGSGKRRREEA